MPNFNIVKKHTPSDSFRSAYVRSSYDLQSKQIVEEFCGSIDIESLHWNVGLIVGGSGTGKSTIIREIFPDCIVGSFDYVSDSVIDDMPETGEVNDIFKMFSSVGFGSPTSWLKPYSVLSNGEKMRVDLARALLEDRDTVVFDEFTSVVDREVAKTGSLAVSRAVRRHNKKFVAVSCHYDIVDWLSPDWIYDTTKQHFRCAGGRSADRALKLKFMNLKLLTNKTYGRYLKSIII